MIKVIFVYAGSVDNTSNCSPYTITRNVWRALQTLDVELQYCEWSSYGPFPEVDQNTIILGHPNFPPNTPIQTLFQYKAKAKILIFPLHLEFSTINMPFDNLVKQSDVVLSIMGQYWYDNLEQSKEFGHWKPKIKRLDMAIDSSQFPFVKTKYLPPGQRAFYYLGSDRPEKGLGQMATLFAGTQHKIHLYGMLDENNPLVRLPNAVMHGWADTAPQFARDLATCADCLINTSVSDACPTTLIEGSSWGFQIAATPQSGHWPSKPFHGLNLPADIEGCRHFLNYIQYAPENELLERAKNTRLIIERDYNWSVFTTKVLDVVRSFV